MLLGRPFLETRAALIDVQKGELTIDAESCMAVENNSLLNVELNSDCILQHSINEIEMNFQYLESIDCEMLPSSMYNKVTISSINENSQDDVCSQGQKTAEQETSA